MIGFQSLRNVTSVLKVKSYWKYNTELQKHEVCVTANATKETMWSHKLIPELMNAIGCSLEKEGMFPRKNGYVCEPEFSGYIEIGEKNEQNSWSDDTYIAFRADTPGLLKIAAEALEKACPVNGGGVPGSSSYRGSGMKEPSGLEQVYHYSSYGIGD